MTVLIEGMSCAHCVASVEKALKNQKGLKNIQVEIGKAVFEAPKGFDQGKIKDAIEDAGFDVSSIAE